MIEMKAGVIKSITLLAKLVYPIKNKIVVDEHNFTNWCKTLDDFGLHLVIDNIIVSRYLKQIVCSRVGLCIISQTYASYLFFSSTGSCKLRSLSYYSCL